MEHLLVLLIQFFLWLDQLSVKPLRKVVSNLDTLRSKPRQVLAGEPVTIGPRQRWGSAIGLGLIVSTVLWFLIFIAIKLVEGGRVDFFEAMARALLPSLALLVPVTWIMVRLFRGGYVILTTDGVDFDYRLMRVRCPWALFNTPGSPFQPAKDRVLIPVVASATPLIEQYRSELLAQQGGGVVTKQLTLKARNLLELRALYEVELPEVAELLLHIGRLLGDTAPDMIPPDEPVASEPEFAPTVPLVRQADGWLKASLIHLTFPPYCSACGRGTFDLKEYPAYSHGIHTERSDLFESGETVPIKVPVCTSCQQVQLNAQRRGAMLGLFFGLIVAAIATLLVVWLTEEEMLLVLSIPFGAMGAIFGALYGNGVGRMATKPIRLRRYSSTEGTVQLRFRNRDYEDALMELLGGVEEMAPPEKTESVYSEQET